MGLIRRPAGRVTTVVGATVAAVVVSAGLTVAVMVGEPPETPPSAATPSLSQLSVPEAEDRPRAASSTRSSTGSAAAPGESSAGPTPTPAPPPPAPVPTPPAAVAPLKPAGTESSGVLPAPAPPPFESIPAPPPAQFVPPSAIMSPPAPPPMPQLNTTTSVPARR